MKQIVFFLTTYSLICRGAFYKRLDGWKENYKWVLNENTHQQLLNYNIPLQIQNDIYRGQPLSYPTPPGPQLQDRIGEVVFEENFPNKESIVFVQENTNPQRPQNVNQGNNQGLNKNNIRRPSTTSTFATTTQKTEATTSIGPYLNNVYNQNGVQMFIDYKPVTTDAANQFANYNIVTSPAANQFANYNPVTSSAANQFANYNPVPSSINSPNYNLQTSPPAFQSSNYNVVTSPTAVKAPNYNPVTSPPAVKLTNPVTSPAVIQSSNYQPATSPTAVKPPNYNPATTPTAIKEDFNSIASPVVTRFGIDLMKKVAQSQIGNTVISPYSVAMILNILLQGARGETGDQISNVLNMSPELAEDTFRKFSTDITKRAKNNNILTIANGVFIVPWIKLTPKFSQATVKSFHSEIYVVSFTDPPVIVPQINKWVAKKTGNKIDKLLTLDMVSTSTQMLLLDAIYFKGKWKSMFNADATTSRSFYLSDGTPKRVEFMRTRQSYKGGVDKKTNAQIVILPFEADEYSLMVILPPERSSVSNILSNLNEADLARYQNFSTVDIELELPKFNIKADTNLESVLKSMGVTKVFSSESDLGDIGASPRSEAVHLTTAIHSASFSIDEQGGSGAAATAFGVVALSYESPEFSFKINRPFLAILWDNRLSVPLFISRIEDPS